MRSSLNILALACGLGLAQGAAAITIDGNLADWGLHHNGLASDWVPDTGIHYVVDDFTTGPSNAGGQAYDVEAMYLKIDAGTLYIALVTGHDPATVQKPTAKKYARGDLAINFTGQDYDHTFEFAISTATRNGFKQGGVYAVTSWNSDLTQARPDIVTTIARGQWLGQAELAISDAFTGMGEGPQGHKHWAYEAAVPLSLFNGFLNEKLWVQWTTTGAADVLRVDPPLTSVDAPPALALFTLGVPALLRRRRHR